MLGILMERGVLRFNARLASFVMCDRRGAYATCAQAARSE
jgi:hypothetical protein